MLRKILFFISLIMLSCMIRAIAAPKWQTLPPTPNLPKASHSDYAKINGTRIWYAEFGQGDPVILLHGGFANSNYWGKQVPALAKKYRVIVMDSRGHGRSANDNHKPYNYDVMAADVISMMDFLQLKQAAMIGWSDGAIIGLKVAINYPKRLTKLFAFAANSDPNGVLNDSKNPLFQRYLTRTNKEYQKLSPTPNQYQTFYNGVMQMWETQPNITKEQLQSIKIPTWIVDADHDEAIKRENTLFMADNIPNAGLLIQPWVSHFSFIQDPEQFNHDILHFLEKK